MAQGVVNNLTIIAEYDGAVAGDGQENSDVVDGVQQTWSGGAKVPTLGLSKSPYLFAHVDRYGNRNSVFLYILRLWLSIKISNHFSDQCRGPNSLGETARPFDGKRLIQVSDYFSHCQEPGYRVKNPGMSSRPAAGVPRCY